MRGKMVKKAQAWGFDLTIAMSIFIFGILVFFLYTLNLPQEGTGKIDDLKYEGDLVAESLMSEGLPENWTSDNVVKIGILTDGKIDQAKLNNLSILIDADYERTKTIFNIHYDYFVNFSSQMTIEDESVSGIGLAPTSQENLIKTTRFTSYKGQPVTLFVDVWD